MFSKSSVIYLLHVGNGYDHQLNNCVPVSGADGQRVLVLSIPRFCETGMAVLVNLRTLEAVPLVCHSDIGECEMDTNNDK